MAERRYARNYGRLLALTLWSTLALANVFLAARLLWNTRNYETARGVVAQTWWDATAGWLGAEHTPVSERMPAEQAEFWLAEAQRVLDQDPNSPEVAMGAAWMLDSPGTGFYRQCVVVDKDLAQFYPQAAFGVDWSRIEFEEGKYERKCHQECLAAARRATELDSEDVRWWRMRAILQFQYSLANGQRAPRSSEWRSVLEEAAGRDPENALYDYLTARQLWSQSAEFEWSEETEGYVLRIDDPDVFFKGCRSFDAAQQKAFLAYGESGLAAPAEFLDRASLWRCEQSALAMQPLHMARLQSLYIDLFTWQTVRAADALANHDVNQARKFREEQLHLMEQVGARNETLTFDLVRHGRLSRTRWALCDMAEENPADFTDEDKAAFVACREQAEVSYSVVREALKRVAAEDDVGTKSFADLSSGLVAEVAVQLAGAALLIALPVGCLFAIVLRGARHDRPFGIARHALCWILAAIATTVVLGLAPAEVISRDVQQAVVVWSVRIIGVIALGAPAVWFLFNWRRRNYRMTIRTVLILTTACAVLLAFVPMVAVPLIQQGIDLVDDHRLNLWLPARGTENLSADDLRIAYRMQSGSWIWAMLQWLLGRGPMVTVVMALLLITFWQAVRTVRETDRPWWRVRFATCRQLGGRIAVSIAASSLCAALLGMAAYWASVEPSLRRVEQEYQSDMAYLRDPSARVRRIQNAIAAIEGESDTMEYIRTQAQAAIASEDEWE